MKIPGFSGTEFLYTHNTTDQNQFQSTPFLACSCKLIPILNTLNTCIVHYLMGQSDQTVPWDDVIVVWDWNKYSPTYQNQDTVISWELGVYIQLLGVGIYYRIAHVRRFTCHHLMHSSHEKVVERLVSWLKQDRLIKRSIDQRTFHGMSEDRTIKLSKIVS